MVSERCCRSVGMHHHVRTALLLHKDDVCHFFDMQPLVNTQRANCCSAAPCQPNPTRPTREKVTCCRVQMRSNMLDAHGYALTSLCHAQATRVLDSSHSHASGPLNTILLPFYLSCDRHLTILGSPLPLFCLEPTSFGIAGSEPWYGFRSDSHVQRFCDRGASGRCSAPAASQVHRALSRCGSPDRSCSVAR